MPKIEPIISEKPVITTGGLRPSVDWKLGRIEERQFKIIEKINEIIAVINRLDPKDQD